MDDLEREYLGAAYELAMTNPRRAFYQDEIAADFDLDYGPNSDEVLVADIASGLMGRGYIETDRQNPNLGRVALRLTSAGKAEAERLADPIEQRKELRETSFGPSTNRRTAARHACGLARFGAPVWPRRHTDASELDRGHRRPTRGMGLITIEADEGGIYRITAKGVDEVEGTTREPQPQQNVSNVFNMSGTFYQAAVGTHNTNTFSGDLDFSTVERRIEEEGGADKEELRELVAEVRELLESGQTLEKGRLARFNDKLKQYPWLAGPVAGWLLNFGTQEIGQYLN